MQSDVKTIYNKNQDIISRTILDETILVPISGNLANMQNIFSLDSVSAFIWEHIDGTKTLNDIHQLVVHVFDVEASQALKDIYEFIDELENSELIAIAEG